MFSGISCAEHYVKLGVRRENIVFVSGMGCASRLPYYLNTYGFNGLQAGSVPHARRCYSRQKPAVKGSRPARRLSSTG